MRAGHVAPKDLLITRSSLRRAPPLPPFPSSSVAASPPGRFPSASVVARSVVLLGQRLGAAPPDLVSELLPSLLSPPSPSLFFPRRPLDLPAQPSVLALSSSLVAASAPPLPSLPIGLLASFTAFYVLFYLRDAARVMRRFAADSISGEY